MPVTNRLIISHLVSTIIPVHNRPDGLVEAVNSVLAQDYRPIEVIIVDDGSSDATSDVGRRLAAENPSEVIFIRQDNQGPGVAREKGLQRSKGEFIQYLDSDDLLLPGKFERQAAGLVTAPDRGVSYGWTRFRHTDGTLEPRPWKGSGTQVDTMFPSFLMSRWWDTPNPLYRRAVCETAGPWQSLWVEEDWEYDCRVASLGTRLHHVPDYVCEVRGHDGYHLGRSWRVDIKRLADRACAHQLILEHAHKAGIGEDTDEMRHFARALFLLARECGAAGLTNESRTLFGMARQASTRERSKGVDFRLYGIGARLMGWKVMGKLSRQLDGWRA